MATPSKQPWANATIALPLASLGLIALVFLFYYFPVSRRQESSLNDRAFRALAEVSNKLRTRASNYADILEQASKLQDKNKISVYLDDQVQEIALDGPANSAECVPQSTTVDVELDQDTYDLQFSCGHWKAKTRLDLIVAPFLKGTPDDIFDEVLFSDPGGGVLYQTIKTANRIKSLPSSFVQTVISSGSSPQQAGVPFAEASQSNSIQTLRLGDTDYRAYLIPVLFSLPGTEAAQRSKGDARFQMVLCALMKQSRFHAENMAVPAGALVVAMIMLLLVIAGSAPYLKYSSMPATERIRRRAALYFFLLSLATVMLAAIFVLHVRYLLVPDSAIDSNLRDLADTIDQNLEKELKRSLLLLDDVSHSSLFKTATCTTQEDAKVQIQLLSTDAAQLTDYPYFDRIFWVDDGGHQQIKWEVGQQRTPQTNVTKRPYFQATVNGDLWRFAEPDPTDYDRAFHPDRTDSRFRVDSLFSINTGRYVAVISRKIFPTEPAPCRNLRMVSMVTPLLSLIDPVLPPDYGFAVIDENGDVLFHSDSTKNGQDNFYNQSADAAIIKASALARQATHITADYLGFDHRLWITPLQRIQLTSWSLIVFHDRAAADEQHIERIVLFSFLALLYYLAIFIVLCVVPLSPHLSASLWPLARNRGMYMRIVLSLIVVTAAYYLLIFELTLGTVVIAVFVIPFIATTIWCEALKLNLFVRGASWAGVAVLVVIAAYNAARASSSWNPIAWTMLIVAGVFIARSPRAETLVMKIPGISAVGSFTSACVLTLVLTGVLPSIAFFKVAYDYYENLSTRKEQLQMMQQLAQREQRVKERYRRVAVRLKQSKTQEDVDKWLFIRRRLEETLDRYDLEFADRKPDLTFVPRDAAALETSGREQEDRLPQILVWLASWSPYGDQDLARYLSDKESGGSVWSWNREASNRIRLHQMHAGGEWADRSAPMLALFKAVSNDPVFLGPDLTSDVAVLNRPVWPVPLLTFLAIFLVTFYWIKPTIRRMFMVGFRWTDVFEEVQLTGETALNHHLIVLAVDHIGAAAVLKQRKDVFLIDLAHGAIENIALDDIQEPIVAIHHFDRSLNEKAAGEATLALLERLFLDCPDKTVVLVATIDPVFHLMQGYTPSAAVVSNPAVDRWWPVLRRFGRVRAPADPNCPPEDRFRLFWLNSTAAERIALYQIAHDGWPNPQSGAALNHLHERGFIAGTPVRLIDDAFRQWIVGSISSEERKLWIRHDVGSAWNSVRLMFFVLAVGLFAAFLFFRQQSVLGLVATSVGVLTPLTQLLSQTQTFKSLLGFKTENAKS